MFANESVEETIQFFQDLTTPVGDPAEHTKLRDEIVQALGLSGVRRSKVGSATVRGISGGQRRRVSLARGAIRQAKVLFCDEPTSGLSATDAMLCVKALKLLTQKLGTTIVVVIHQPRIEAVSYTHLTLPTIYSV
eukprot:TRINITY_DN27720_c0_g1_i1.p2 TRINITY_DN27720_c0_g1~~TRINITY_DN27720_c0_g1_i1.p2  ORF type:complete len:135 (-),score=35.19 TRINITY_DN27720_c0_g1_i1:116-520(-)